MLKDFTYKKFKYILYLPSDEINLPLIVVLHGSGEVGTSLTRLKEREPYPGLKNENIKPNAAILIPLLPKGSWGSAAEELKQLIDYVVTEHKCDINRISITGHSLGGAGVFDMLLKYPDYFAAAAALSPCKLYTIDQLKTIAHVPLWLFYGENEGKYGEYTRIIKNRIDQGYCNAEITCIKNKGHAIQFCWTDMNYHIFENLINNVTEID